MLYLLKQLTRFDIPDPDCVLTPGQNASLIVTESGVPDLPLVDHLHEQLTRFDVPYLDRVLAIVDSAPRKDPGLAVVEQ